ncbi:MAG: hypothetical protein FRX49_00708 [Trebouxia sp. A1-2]|nr:MAG: hypothetical protein FRX49_00708 [Trebouxia sp. A1-2]
MDHQPPPDCNPHANLGPQPHQDSNPHAQLWTTAPTKTATPTPHLDHSPTRTGRPPTPTWEHKPHPRLQPPRQPGPQPPPRLRPLRQLGPQHLPRLRPPRLLGPQHLLRLRTPRLLGPQHLLRLSSHGLQPLISSHGHHHLARATKEALKLCSAWHNQRDMSLHAADQPAGLEVKHKMAYTSTFCLQTSFLMSLLETVKRSFVPETVSETELLVPF